MGVGKYNHEHYNDPTAQAALSAVVSEEKEKSPACRPVAYICSPFAGDMERNAANARRYARFAIERGVVPFAPHLLYPQILDEHDKAQRALGLYFGILWLGKCDELWVFGSNVSAGMKREIAHARETGMPIRFFNDKCEEVFACSGH